MTHKPDNSHAETAQATTDRKPRFWHNPGFPRRTAKAIVYTLLLIAGFCGLMTLANTEDAKYRSTLSKWPTALGNVTSITRGEDDDWDRELGWVKTATLTVTYIYNVQGVTYQGFQKWRFPTIEGSYDEEHVERVESKYPTGSSVTVYYDPTELNKSLLDASAIDISGTSGAWLGVVAVYLGIFGFVSLVYVWGWWIRRK